MTDFKESVFLLKQLIAAPSFSKSENATADIIQSFLNTKKIQNQRDGNNVWAKNKFFKPELPTILLNSHHDTVRPVAGWVRNPFDPLIEKDRLYGLGSNDAGGSLCALAVTFCHFYERSDLDYNLIFAASAEEEISGTGGIASILPKIGTCTVGIIGEPTKMQPAVAEKGLMVIDAVAIGKAGHAARNEGVNAIYIAMQDIEKIRRMHEQRAVLRTSPLLGEVRVNVTQIQAGTQHNVVPDRCTFVIDVRTNELYSNEDMYHFLATKLLSTLTPRSTRLNSSKIDLNHPLVQRCIALGLTPFGSPTLSDQALIPFDTLKIGCGDSARSHTADEYIELPEMEKGIQIYKQLLEGLML
jgi:acetylornithine deacetylase